MVRPRSQESFKPPETSDCQLIILIHYNKKILAFVELPNLFIELAEPYGASSPITKFSASNQKGALHHLCFEVADIEGAVEQCSQETGWKYHKTIIRYINPDSTKTWSPANTWSFLIVVLESFQWKLISSVLIICLYDIWSKLIINIRIFNIFKKQNPTQLDIFYTEGPFLHDFRHVLGAKMGPSLYKLYVEI